MYSQKESTGPQSTISLLVFQAMLFASCNFVSLHVIKQLGFSSLRTARAEFYRRTKVGVRTTRWLGNIVSPSRSSSPSHDGLGVTVKYDLEPIQDLAEFSHPARQNVFTPATKRRQISIFPKFLELMILLTNVLTLVYSFEDSVKSKVRSAGVEDLAFEKFEAALKAWYLRVSAQPTTPFENAQEELYGRENDQDKSIVLQTNLMYIYYHTASIALSHSKMLRQPPTSESNSGDTARQVRYLKLQQSSLEVQDAAQKITECYKELTRRRLARWLPVSVLSCLATPLTLHAISARLSSLTSNQERLEVLVETLNVFFPQDYGVEWVKQIVRHVANLAQVDSQCISRTSGNSPTDWSQILRSQPSMYLKMIWTFDVRISKGRQLEEFDFQAWMRCLLKGSKGSRARLHRLSYATEQATSQAGLTDDDTMTFATDPKLSTADVDIFGELLMEMSHQ
ncbi:cutinase transcription factor 1 beta [Fusarium coicis]|nr:cutinase transcription factor 1 beta [Fusarium coicis]